MMYLTKEEQKMLYPEFEKQALPHMDALYNYALRITGKEKQAADLLKETFLRAFGFYKFFVEGSDHKMWLFRIMYNIITKKYSRSQEYDENEIENTYSRIKSEYIKLEKDLLSSIEPDTLSDILSSLPDKFKTVIILRDIEGFSYEQITDLVDVPKNTVRTRLYRGRKMLYNKLFEYGEKKGLLKSGKGDSGER